MPWRSRCKPLQRTKSFSLYFIFPGKISLQSISWPLPSPVWLSCSQAGLSATRVTPIWSWSWFWLSLAIHPTQCEALGPGAGDREKGWGPYPQGLTVCWGLGLDADLSDAFRQLWGGWRDRVPGESLAVAPRWQGPGVPWVAGGHVPLWSDLETSPHEEMVEWGALLVTRDF